MMKINMHTESWALEQPFRIAGREQRASEALVVELDDGDCVGRGESQGIFYFDETADTMLAQIEAVAAEIRQGVSREKLLGLPPCGGARNAVDCALWDLAAKRSGKTVWELTGIDPRPVRSVFTIGIEATPGEMAKKAVAAADYPVLKVKLDGDRPVGAAACDPRSTARCGPGRRRQRGAGRVESPLVLAADESRLDSSELETAAARYGMINIKLDKTGGLKALALARAAREKGCQLMVGNMLGTSLAMAPSFVIAQLCDFVDIDGPPLLKYDRPHGLVYEKGMVRPFDRRLWG